MDRVCFLLLLTLACFSLVGARTNYCIHSGPTIYKPVQLYPSDCPINTSYCMSELYQYNAALFKSKAVATLLPKARETLAYLTQDENDNIDAVVITATTYTNNVINTQVNAYGVTPADILVKDDPIEDTWYWNPATNYGNFTWLLQPSYTDGVVFGHFNIIDNFCMKITLLPNWPGAIATMSSLTGSVSKTSRVAAKSVSTTPGVYTYLEFCLYPEIVYSKVDASCGTPGSATAVSLNKTASATYRWTKDDVLVGTTSTISGLSAGTYTVIVTVDGCEAKRTVNIQSVGNVYTYSHTATAATLTKLGKISLSISGGYPPYAITIKNSVGTTIATNVTTVNVPAGEYTVRVFDGCSDNTYPITIDAPGSCPAGSYVDEDTDDCTPCLAGTYSSSSNSAKCTPCAPGSWNNVAGATTCTQCGSNTISNGVTQTCSSCPQNTFSAPGSAICTPCALGSQRAPGASSCSSCSDGSYRCDINSLCQACAPGTFSTASHTTCELCAPGTAQSASGKTSCSACPANTYAAAGASSCTPCPTGTSAPAGSSVLLACM